MLFVAGGRGTVLIMPCPLSGCLRSRAFCWCIICSCNSNGSFRKLEKSRGFFFWNFIIFKNFPPTFFNILKWSISSTETNNTSAESPWSQLLFDFLKKGLAWSWWCHASRREKHRSAWGKKSYFRAGGRGSLMIMPHPLSGCQIKAEIKGCLELEGQGRSFIMRAWGWPAVKFSKWLAHPVLKYFTVVCILVRIQPF